MFPAPVRHETECFFVLLGCPCATRWQRLHGPQQGFRLDRPWPWGGSESVQLSFPLWRLGPEPRVLAGPASSVLSGRLLVRMGNQGILWLHVSSVRQCKLVEVGAWPVETGVPYGADWFDVDSL